MKNREKIVFSFVFVSFLAACGGSDENYLENINKTNTKAMFNSIQTLATDGKAWIRLDDDMALLDLHTGEVIKDSKIATNGSKGDSGKAANPIGRGFVHYQGDSAIYASTTSLVMLKYGD